MNIIKDTLYIQILCEFVLLETTFISLPENASGKSIERKIRNVGSSGMLCSAG
jgi:tRNA-binding EMAP/Myf-like protein